MTGPGPDLSHQYEDEQALRALAADYAAAVDGCDGVMLAALFVPTGELVVPGFPDDLGRMITRTGHDVLRRLPDGLRHYQRTFHQVSNHRYSIDGDRATGAILCVAHHVTSTDDGRGEDGRVGTDTVWFIRYDDGYERTGAGWRFTRRVLHLQWVEEHAIAVLAPAPADRAAG